MSQVVLVLVSSVSCNPQENNFLVKNRIVGGDEVDISEVPWQVALQNNGNHFCGGSIISEKYVVTAAHCTDEILLENIATQVGSSFKQSSGQIVGVKNIYQHPNYISSTNDFDISILELESPLEFGSEISPVSLPSSDKVWEVGTSAFVTGWGLTSEDGSTSSQLRGATVHIISKSDCIVAYDQNLITSRMLCADNPKRGKDACQGDSGGPMVVGDVLAGIVSWGEGCARPDAPGVYTDVAVLRDFIKENTGI
ncbi:trypsin-3-like isoform X2 [Tribolium madens]|uniref:trypsin-3-like isoform X2 n=1 Tax=Tribolium madens TaxID=41895 RepID=UPI001CF758E0|nr:trypsin-3-like isoform X2 [Tribolium madens]